MIFRNQQKENEEDREKKRREERVECMAEVLDLFTKSERGRERAAGEGPEGARGRSALEFERAGKILIELNEFLKNLLIELINFDDHLYNHARGTSF